MITGPGGGTGWRVAVKIGIGPASVSAVARYGAQFGPDITFLGVEPCDWAEPETYPQADVVILGAPSTVAPRTAPAPASGRSTSGRPAICLTTAPGPRWRCGSTGSRISRSSMPGTWRCSPAMPPAPWPTCRPRSTRSPRPGRSPGPRRGPHDRLAGRRRGGPASRPGPDLDDPLRCPCRHRQRGVRLADRARPADASADRVRGLRGDRFLQIGLRGYWPEPETLSWMADQRMRSYEMTEIGARGSPSA